MAVGSHAFETHDTAPAAFDLHQSRTEAGTPVAQLSQKLVAGHGAPQLASRKTAAGHDHFMAKIAVFPAAEGKALRFPADFLHRKSRDQGDIGLVHSQPQHIHHGVGLVGIGVHPSGGLRHRIKSQGAEPGKGLLRGKPGQGLFGKVRRLSVVAPFQGVKVCQVAPAVSRGQELPPHPALALQNQHLHLRVFRRRQGRRHAGGSGANNPNFHGFTCFLVLLYRKRPFCTRKTFLQWEKPMV